MKYSKLTGRIIEAFGTRQAFANVANISNSYLSQKLNGLQPLSLQEVREWSRILDIPKDEIADYFNI